MKKILLLMLAVSLSTAILNAQDKNCNKKCDKKECAGKCKEGKCDKSKNCGKDGENKTTAATYKKPAKA
jgi:hypothetical protein